MKKNNEAEAKRRKKRIVMFNRVKVTHNKGIQAFSFPLRALMLAMTAIFCQTARVGAQQLLLPIAAQGESESRLVAIDSLQYAECGADSVGLSLSFCLMGKGLPRQERVAIVPRLTDDQGHEVRFPTVDIYGAWAYYHTVRATGRKAPDHSQQFTSPTLQYRSKQTSSYQHYEHALPRQPWMEQARLSLTVVRTDGCGRELSREERELRTPTPLVTTWQDEGTSEEQVMHLQGRAYVTFPVSRTEVLADFRDNRRELERLSHTIDSVSNDTTVEIRQIQIKGFASPEGPYDNNDRLARMRTSSLTRYIIEQTNVSPMLFHTAYEAEDWAGLRQFADTTALHLAHRTELLQLIDSVMDPDARLQLMASRYPADYSLLREHAFPLLRHTDYQIDYTLKNVTRQAGAVHSDTTYRLLPDTTLARPLQQMEMRRFRPYTPLLAVKTNVLFDLLLAPNIEVEVPFGRQRQWSIMAEYCNPWYRFGHNSKGDANRYHRNDQHPTRHAYEVQTGGVELRYWPGRACGMRPVLTGLFVGIYGAGGKYDVERNSKGYQGEFTSAGISAGYSWVLSRHWNLELSGSVGYVGGPQRRYEAEFDDARLIFRNYDRLRYVGPTKLKVSLVWVLGKKKGGAL